MKRSKLLNNFAESIALANACLDELSTKKKGGAFFLIADNDTVGAHIYARVEGAKKAAFVKHLARMMMTNDDLRFLIARAVERYEMLSQKKLS